MNAADRRGGQVRESGEVLGYLVKHVHLLLESRTDAALDSLGITARDLGVLRVIAGGAPASQQEIAARVGVDRTSMVAIVDALQDAGVVARVPSETDRRRNIVMLTEAGRQGFDAAERVVLKTERSFLAALGEEGSATFRSMLASLLDGAASDGR